MRDVQRAATEYAESVADKGTDQYQAAINDFIAGVEFRDVDIKKLVEKIAALKVKEKQKVTK